MSSYLTPEDLYQELFYEVHKAHLFKDGKSFSDARAKMNPSIIYKTFQERSKSDDFNLEQFIHKYFDLPKEIDAKFDEEVSSIDDHISRLWEFLSRPADRKDKKSSKITLPYPYVVPGGRFDEIYYWDSYFTMLGLAVSQKEELIEHMINNFKYLIESVGHIPNGNRTYFKSRSQPPFYSLMVKLLIKLKGQELIPNYMNSLISEYNFWMQGLSTCEVGGSALRVYMPTKGAFLNRYYDDLDTPRVEMYRDDWELIDFAEDRNLELFRHLRAACESGWDFSSRWMDDPADLRSIRTLDIIPVDLNCLLWHHEKLISECYKAIGTDELYLQYGMLSVSRKESILKYFWDESDGFFKDYDSVNGRFSEKKTLAGLYPLFLKLANQDQADSVAKIVEQEFLKEGGVVTTLISSDQQWDSPNGWAPLQWVTVKGLLNYRHKDLAQEIAQRWLALNEKIFESSGKMIEKYNVVDTDRHGSGGEYDVQDGFGWTNGVYQAIKVI